MSEPLDSCSELDEEAPSLNTSDPLDSCSEPDEDAPSLNSHDPVCKADGYRVLHNRCFGGFSFSKAFVQEFRRRHPGTRINIYDDDHREDPKAIALFDEMGSAASSGKHAKLKSTVVPPGCKYRLREYDGMETMLIMPAINKAEIIDDLLQMLRQKLELAQSASEPIEPKPMTRRLLASNMTFKEFKAQLFGDMDAYKTQHCVQDKP
jgi:hypothetical protein